MVNETEDLFRLNNGDWEQKRLVRVAAPGRQRPLALLASNLPQLVPASGKAGAFHFPPHTPAGRGRNTGWSQAATTPALVDLLKDTHHALGCIWLDLCEQVIRIFTALPQIQKRDFGLTVGVAFAKYLLKPGYRYEARRCLATHQGRWSVPYGPELGWGSLPGPARKRRGARW